MILISSRHTVPTKSLSKLVRNRFEKKTEMANIPGKYDFVSTDKYEDFLKACGECFLRNCAWLTIIQLVEVMED